MRAPIFSMQRLRVFDLEPAQGGYKAPKAATPSAPPMPSAPGVPDHSSSARPGESPPVNQTEAALQQKYRITGLQGLCVTEPWDKRPLL